MTARVALLVVVFASCQRAPATVRIGSKAFTESVILGEILLGLAHSTGQPAEHRKELGGTRILWNALLRGEIDLYAEYTGTIAEEILGGDRSEEEMRKELAARGIRMGRPLGFDNTYALGMREDVAKKRGISTLSDLASHPDLHFGFSSEFMDRADGWPALRRRYSLPHENVTGLEHNLAYRGLQGGEIHVTDLYSTDAEIEYYGLRVLKDDLSHFPDYHAVLLVRADLWQRAPQLARALDSIEDRIADETMVAMNAAAKLEKVPESQVAREFLATALGITWDRAPETAFAALVRRTREHLMLVTLSLLAAIVVAVPLGVWAAKKPRLGHVMLGLVGTLQTVPSLALLVFLIPLLGIGSAPALLALFLYSLLPIVRNTVAGLRDISPPLRESAEALGLPSAARVWQIELTLASRSIVAGIKTSAVMNVGTATLGALIGAGGYGQPILTGIRLDDTGLILQGAVPAALLALLTQGLFELAERFVVPKGLRL